MKISRIVCALFITGTLCAQTTPPVQDEGGASKPLGDVARESKRKTAPKSKVLTNEDLAKSSGPIPDISLDGEDNTEQIIKAIDTYQHEHTPQELESAVHSWYDDHDAMLAQAFRENQRISDRSQSSYYVPSESLNHEPGDERQYYEQQNMRANSQLSDRRTVQLNYAKISRIQSNFTRVRSALQSMNLRYEWMRVRCGNSYCS